MFERLRQLRYKIALEENIPAYLVFSDATLKEIERERPMSEADFLTISGVGQRKLEVYGDEFIAEIQDFMGSKVKKPKKEAKQTPIVTIIQPPTNVEVVKKARKEKGDTEEEG